MSSPGSSYAVQLGPAETLAGYDRWSDTYDHEDNPLLAATAWVLDHSPLGCADADVLELGCGTGRHIPRLLGDGARSYLGVDGSAGMLGIAAQRVTDRRVAFAHADLLSPWMPPRTFDLAFVVLVLEHLPVLDELAHTLARAVRPGGRLRIIDLHPERVATGVLAHFHDGGTEVRFASVAHPIMGITDALERAGFEVVRRDWLASDAMIAAVPALGRYRGVKLVLDLKATRRGVEPREATG